MVAEDMSVEKVETIEREEAISMLIQKGVKPRFARDMYDRNLTEEEILDRLKEEIGIPEDQGIVPKFDVTDFDRKAAFGKLAFWLREFGDDDDMAHFIEQIALKKNFARDYRVQMHLLKMFTKLFKAAETFDKPYVRDNTTIKQYTDRWKALKKETTSIRTFINRLLHTTYRGTKRKLHGGTRDDSRGSPDPG